ncbi:MAG: LptF/LptG family permease [Bacteroidetes bacterium]|nr:LptF/LptG family permease [Bacteroidota bacterium]
MKKLHLLLIRSFLGPFILIFIVVLFLLLMQFLWRYIDDLVGKGLEILTIGELMFYTAASLVPLALPLAILMASLMTYGNLGENYELTALKSAGISLQRIMLPLILVNLMIALAAFFFANNVLPIANLKMRSLLYDIKKQRPELQIRPGEFYNGIEDYTVRVGTKDPETNVLYDILIYDHSERSGNRYVTRADSGYMKMTNDSRFLLITLYDGHSYSEMKEKRKPRLAKTYPHRYDEFAERNMIISLSGFGLERTDESLFRSNYQMMNLNQLRFYQDSLKRDIFLRQQSFYSNLSRRSYAESPFTRNRVPPARPEDTIPRPDTVQVMNVYNQLTIREKQRVVDDAINKVRSGASYISSTSDFLDSKEKRLNKYRLEWHRKFILASATFIFLFIGAPLGAIIRRGGIGMPVVVSTILFIFYYIITLTSEKVVTEGKANFFWLWSPPVILFIIGVFLTYKAATDSVIMNADTYIRVFNKFIQKLGIRKKQTLLQS